MSELREFGKFRLDTEKKQLWFEDNIIELSLKSIEVLCVLTETKEVVSKEELLQRVWQGAFTEESNISGYIYRLRKMFVEYGESEEIIQTISKRGYRFNGKVTTISFSPNEKTETQSIDPISIREKVKNQVNNINKPRLLVLISICLILLLVTLGFYTFQSKTEKVDGVKTIAIGKFTSLSDNEEEKVLALGIKEKILLNLGNLKDLQVQNISLDEADFDKVNNADAVLLGTVQKTEEQIRVNLRLLRTSDKKQLWGASFDQPKSGLFKLQDEISSKVTDSLAVNLTQFDRDKIYKRPTENKEAYEQYLQGRYFFNQRGVDYSGSLRKSKPFFERAIELDPNFAEAYIGLADVINLQADEKNKLNPKYDIEYQQARQLISKANEISPNLAEAYAANGWIQLRYEWNFAEAEKSLLKAIELNRGLTNAYIWLSQTYQVQGKFDLAVKNAEKALEIEPTLSRALGNLNSNYIYSGQCDMAGNVFKKMIPYYTNPTEKADQEGRFLSGCGKCEEAIPLLEEVKKQKPDSTVLAYNLGYCYAVKNQPDKARNELKTLEGNANLGHSIFGRILVHSALGEKEKSFEVLNQFYKSKDPRILRTLYDPRLKEFQNEPKFKEIMRGLNPEK